MQETLDLGPQFGPRFNHGEIVQPPGTHNEVTTYQETERSMASKQQVHQFGKTRPAQDGKFNIHVATSQKDRDERFRPLPPPPNGNEPPFHLVSRVRNS